MKKRKYELYLSDTKKIAKDLDTKVKGKLFSLICAFGITKVMKTFSKVLKSDFKTFFKKEKRDFASVDCEYQRNEKAGKNIGTPIEEIKKDVYLREKRKKK